MPMRGVRVVPMRHRPPMPVFIGGRFPVVRHVHHGYGFRPGMGFGMGMGMGMMAGAAVGMGVASMHRSPGVVVVQ